MSETTPSHDYPITRQQTGLIKIFLKMMKVAPFEGGDVDLIDGAVRILSGYSSSYLIPTGADQQEYFMIDAGADPRATDVQAFLRYKNLSNTAIKAIFITHGHSDHTAGLPVFPDADVYVGEGDRAFIAGRAAGEGALPKLQGPQPKLAVKDPAKIHVVEDGQTVRIGEYDVVGYAVPGHTKGSMAYRIDDVLFCGDAVTFSSDGAAQKPPRPASGDITRAVASLAQLAARFDEEGIALRAVVPNHSGYGSFEAVRELTSET